MKWIFWIWISVLLSSCFLFKDHKRSQFSYTDTRGKAATVATIVPKGFKRQEQIKDSVGNEGVLYHYSGGGQFYIIHSPQKENYQVIDTSMHIPQPHKQGGLFYKGIDSTERWWREAQPPFFRIGYRNIEYNDDALFDSAVNYIKPGIATHRRR